MSKWKDTIRKEVMKQSSWDQLMLVEDILVELSQTVVPELDDGDRATLEAALTRVVSVTTALANER